MERERIIQADWDAEAAVWVATSDDVPGLVTEADSVGVLEHKLRLLVPELLGLNGMSPQQVIVEHKPPYTGPGIPEKITISVTVDVPERPAKSDRLTD